MLSAAVGLVLVMATIPAYEYMTSALYMQGGMTVALVFLLFLFASGVMFLVLGLFLWKKRPLGHYGGIDSDEYKP